MTHFCKIVIITSLLFFEYSFVRAQVQILSGRKVKISELLQASEERENRGDYRGASDFLNQAALIHWENKELRPAINHFQKSLKLNKKVDNQSGMYGIYSNLAMIYADLAKYDSSLMYFRKTLEGRRKSGENVTIISALINNAVVLNNLNRHQEAADFLEEALEIAQEMNDVEQMRSCYGMLAETYEKAGNDEKKLYYFNLYRSFHELLQKQKISRVKVDLEKEKLKAEVLTLEKEKADLEIKNKELLLEEKEQIVEAQQDSISMLTSQFSKKELAIKLLEEKKNAELANQANELQKQKTLNRTISLTAIFLLLLGTIVSYFLVQARKQKKRLVIQHNQLQEQSLILEEQHEQLDTQKSLLEKQTQSLEEGSRVKDRLLSILAHDLRAPFNSINGYLTLLKYEALSQEEIKSLAADLRFSVDHTVETLNNVLAWAKGQMDGMKTKPSDIKILDLITQQQSFYKEISEKKSIKIINQSSENDIAWADYNQIDVVLRNLVGNALKFTPEGGKVSILTEETEDNKILISVTDTGVGMNQEELGKLFKKDEHFSKQGTDEEQGTGLGLLLCKDFVESNGGTLRVTSSEGKGTTFSFDLEKAN